MRSSDRIPTSLWGLLALLTLFWGVNWPVMKIGINEIPIWTFRVTACTLRSLRLFIIARLGKVSLMVRKKAWRRLLLISFFNVFLWNVFVTSGLNLLNSGRSAIIAYTMPIWVMLLSTFFLKEKLNRNRFFGLLFGITGLILLLNKDYFEIN